MPETQGLLEGVLSWQNLTIKEALDGKGILGRYRGLKFTKILFTERQPQVPAVKVAELGLCIARLAVLTAKPCWSRIYHFSRPLHLCLPVCDGKNQDGRTTK